MCSKKIYVIHFDTGRTWRGGQNQVYLLISGLKERNVKQLLITPSGSPLEEKVKELGIETENINPVNDFDIASAFKLRKLIKLKNPDVLHFHTAKSLGMGSLLLRGSRVRTVFTRRVDFPISKNFLNMYKYRYPDSIVVISEFIKAQMIDMGLKNVDKVYSAVDPDKFKYSERGFKDVINIAMAGAFDLYHKDFVTFIECAGIISAKGGEKQIKFHVAGSGKDEKKIRDLIEDAGLSDKIEIAGFVGDMAEFLSSIDILVHTVNYEGLGTIILQAMACGIPVAATDTGGIPEIIEDGINGFLVRKNDPSDAAKKIMRLIEDESLRRNFAVEGRKKIESLFSSRNMVDEYMKLYERLCVKQI